MHALCLTCLGLFALATVLCFFLQRYMTMAENKYTDLNRKILKTWFYEGLVSLAFIALIQFLFSSDWRWETGFTIIALALYAWLYWMKAMKHVVEKIDGLDYDLAAGKSRSFRRRAPSAH